MFALVHKMDLLNELKYEEKQRVFEQKRKQLEDIAAENGLEVEVAKTSIWDKTLYSAWSKIVTQLVPHKKKFEDELQILMEKSGADEGKFKIGGRISGKFRIWGHISDLDWNLRFWGQITGLG